MTDIPQFSPSRQDMVHPIWFEKWERWSQGIYVVSGGMTTQSTTPAMSVDVDAIITTYGSTSGATVTIDAHHDTLARIDVLYQTAAGSFAIHKGDNLAVDDPLGNGNWLQYVSPYPKAALPAGCPLYLIYVGPAVTTIVDADLCPIAAKGISGGANKINGVEVTATGTSITVPHTPAVNTYKLYRNGIRLLEGSGKGFTRVTTAVTLTTAAKLTDVFWHDYEY